MGLAAPLIRGCPLVPDDVFQSVDHGWFIDGVVGDEGAGHFGFSCSDDPCGQLEPGVLFGVDVDVDSVAGHGMIFRISR